MLRLDAATGNVETVVAPGSVEITELGWPAGSPPVDAEDYTTFWRQHLSTLDAFWTDASGHVGPLTEGLSDTHVDVVGAWPDTTVHVTFSWTHRPGIRLRRVVSLFDDLGRAQEPTYADIHIMETSTPGAFPLPQPPDLTSWTSDVEVSAPVLTDSLKRLLVAPSRGTAG